MACIAPAAAQTLVADIAQSPIQIPQPASWPNNPYRAFGGILFGADLTSFGSELWFSDGTVAGTRLLADIEPGYRGSNPRGFATLASGNVVFSAESADLGRELWVTDGTAAGTRLVADLAPGTTGSSPGGLTAIGGVVLFFADDGTRGLELWSTDGTAAGTALVVDLTPGPIGLFAIPPITELSNAALFITAPLGGGWQLWRSDGTAAGTTMLRFEFTATRPRAGGFTTLGTRAVFWGDGAAGAEPWVTDGTSAGTMLLADVLPGALPSQVLGPYAARHFVAAGGRAWFLAFGASVGHELWLTDGTPSGTRIVTTLGSLAARPGALLGEVAGGDLAFMLAMDAAVGQYGLYRSDGTAAGTGLVSVLGKSIENVPTPGVAFAGALYFAGIGNEGTELWRTDGTAAGTAIVSDLRPGATGSVPTEMIDAGGTLVFSADDGTSGRELWLSDGSAAGTRIADLAKGPINSSSHPQLIGVLDGNSYWQVWAGTPGPTSIWRSDGTTAGTTAVLPSAPFVFPPTGFASAVDFAIFGAVDPNIGVEPWVIDSAGVRPLVDLRPGTRGSVRAEFASLGDRIVFAADDGVRGNELWVTDGTAAGTAILADLVPGSSPSDPHSLFAWNGQVFFAATDPTLGTELHVTDGTPSGTRLVQDIYTGRNPALLQPEFTGLGDFVYFAAEDGIHGRELWRSDGTSAGTALVHDTNGISFFGAKPYGMAAVGDRVFFAATVALGQWVLSTDGTPAGTSFVRYVPGRVEGSLQAVDDTQAVYFVSDGANSSALWRTDGTNAGSRQLLTLNTHLLQWVQPEIHNVGDGRVLFTANDGASGQELWVTDGTAAGTRLVVDIAPVDADPTDLQRLGNRVVFSANDGVLGRELHGIDLLDTGAYAADRYGFGCPGTGGVEPSIEARGAVRSSLGSWPLGIDRALPSSAAAVLVGATRLRLPLSGSLCRLWTAPLVALPVAIDPMGSATLNLPAPPVSAGLVLRCQAAVLDPGGAFGGQLSSTSGLEIVIGQ